MTKIMEPSNPNAARMTATPGEAGVWIEGWWGQYGVDRLIDIADDYGFHFRGAEDPRILAFVRLRLELMGTRGSIDAEHGDADELREWSYELADECLEWMNEEVAPEGYTFGWNDGEFMLQSEEWWEEYA